MLLIPMWQPWASAVALGLKKIETRSMPTSYRGIVAIHAAKKWDREIRDLASQLPPLVYGAFGALASTEVGCNILTLSMGRGRCADDPMPLGKIIAVADLIGCSTTVDVVPKPAYPSIFRVRPELDTPLERALGNYGPGRYGWVLSNVRRLREPLPYKAHQGVYQLPPEIERQILERI